MARIVPPVVNYSVYRTHFLKRVCFARRELSFTSSLSLNRRFFLRACVFVFFVLQTPVFMCFALWRFFVIAQLALFGGDPECGKDVHNLASSTRTEFVPLDSNTRTVC